MIEFAILEIIEDNTGTTRPECNAVSPDDLAAITGLPLNAGGRLSKAYKLAGSTDESERITTQPTASDLSGLTGLTTITLSGHSLDELPNGFFSENESLTSVDLSVSQLRTLPAELFDELTQLQTLRLERNFFGTMPDALSKETMEEKLTKLQYLSLGLDVPWESWHFVGVPSGWVESLSNELITLRLKNIRITDTQADWIGTNLTKLRYFQFDYQDMSFGTFIELMAALKENSASIGGFSELHMTSSSDALDGCKSGSSGGSLGNWYADELSKIAAFKTALNGLKVAKLTIMDPTMTATAIDDIIDSIDATVMENIHLECGDLSGFTGESGSDFTKLKTLKLESVGLTNDDFVAIVSNLGDTRISTLDLGSNEFDYVDLTKFDFSGIWDTLRSLDYAPYESCQGPWIADYEDRGLNLLGSVVTDPQRIGRPFVSVNPTPQEEPEECVEPEPVEQLEEQENWESEREPNWPRAIIMRIEPVVPFVRMWTGEQVVLSTNVYGLQNILDNNLADAMPPEKVWFDWGEEERSGDFTEFTNLEIRKNDLADDREVRFIAPDVPGNYRLKANIPHAAMCKKPRAEETAEEAVARCTAEFEIQVRQRRNVDSETLIPKNPSGLIPSSITTEFGDNCPVFTPEEGGESTGPGYSVTAQPGAVPNDSYVAICMEPDGEASNAGQTQHRYTLVGEKYDIDGFDANGIRLTDYSFNTHIEACIPMLDELRHRIGDVELAAINDDKSLTALRSSVSFAEQDIQVCGSVSTLPATVAVGVRGVPGPIPTPEPSIESPDTGGNSPTRSFVLLLLVLGLAAATISVFTVRIARKPN